MTKARVTINHPAQEDQNTGIFRLTFSDASGIPTAEKLIKSLENNGVTAISGTDLPDLKPDEVAIKFRDTGNYNMSDFSNSLNENGFDLCHHYPSNN